MASVIPHINARIDVSDKGEGTYSGQGIAGDIPHGLGSWKAHSELWFAGEWDHGVPVRGVYYDDGWVDFGEFAPDLSRKGWAAAFISDPSVTSGMPMPPFYPPGFNRPPSPTDPATLQAMAALGINDPNLFPGSRRAAKTAAASAARTAAAPLVQAAGDAVPEALQPAARGLVTALQGGGTAELEAAARTAAAPLVQSAGGAVPEALQPAARAAATALTGGGTQELESVAREAINPIVERSVAPLIQEVEQAPGFLDRMVSGLRDLGGRVSNTFRARAPAQVDDPYDLDDPAMNLRMDDPFSEGPLNIDLASRRGLFRLAPEVGEQDSGQNIGNAFSQARAQGELPDLPIFDGMREVPQSSTIQEQQAAANRAFTSDEPAAQQEPPAAQQEQEPATQETEQISGEESIPATVSEEGGIVSEVAPEVAAATGGTSVIAPTIAKVSGEVAEGGGFEFGPLLEGAAILGAVVPQLVSLFEKPESITASYVGDQIGL